MSSGGNETGKKEKVFTSNSKFSYSGTKGDRIGLRRNRQHTIHQICYSNRLSKFNYNNRKEKRGILSSAAHLSSNILIGRDNIVLTCLPNHVGISGVTEEDRMVREAANKPNSIYLSHIEICFRIFAGKLIKRRTTEGR